jgi:hypothetical protein
MLGCAAFVFMSGPKLYRQYVFFSDSPRIVSARKGMDITEVEQTMQTNAWADPGSYAAHLGPAPALFQYTLQDEEWGPRMWACRTTRGDDLRTPYCRIMVDLERQDF